MTHDGRSDRKNNNRRNPTSSTFIEKLKVCRRSIARLATSPSQAEIADPKNPRLFLLCQEFLHRLSTQDLLVQSGSITYTLILSIVPLLGIGFTFFQVFGGLDSLLNNVVIPKIGAYFESQIAGVITGYIRGFVGNIQTEALGATALFTLLVTVVSLLGSIEQAFNRIVGSKTERSMLQRVLNYWMLLTLTPFVLVVSTAKSIDIVMQLSNFLSFSPSTAFQSLTSQHTFLLRFIGAFLAETLGFAILYSVLPAKRPRAIAVIAGACVAAAGFESLQWVNSYFSARFFKEASLVQLYGSVPLLIVILFVWLRLVALVLLAGLVFSSAVDRVFRKGSTTPVQNQSKRGPLKELTSIIHVFSELSASYLAGNNGLSKDSLAQRLQISGSDIERATYWLEENSLLFRLQNGSSKHFYPSHFGVQLFHKPSAFASLILQIFQQEVTETISKASFERNTSLEDFAQQDSAAPQDLFAAEVLNQIKQKIHTN